MHSEFVKESPLVDTKNLDQIFCAPGRSINGFWCTPESQMTLWANQNSECSLDTRGELCVCSVDT